MAYPLQQKGTYASEHYLSLERWNSFWYQIHEVRQLQPKNVLEIGVGNGVVAYTLTQMGVALSSFDFDPANKPDYVGDVSKINSYHLPTFDLVLACQVFEHITYDDFLHSLTALKDVCNRHLVISLPYTARGAVKFYSGLTFRPFFRKFSWARIFILWPKKWQYDGVHHWEIGARNTPLRKVLADIKNNGWDIKRHYPVKENLYHYFIICEKRSS